MIPDTISVPVSFIGLLCIASSTRDCRNERTGILPSLHRSPDREELGTVLGYPRYDLPIVFPIHRPGEPSRLCDRVACHMIGAAVIDVNVRSVMASLLVHLDLQVPELQHEELDEVWPGRATLLGQKVDLG